MHADHHHSNHSHHHGTEGIGGVLSWSLVATLAFVALEVVTGLQSHSLALLSDAGHNFTDALALVLAAFGVYYQRKPADKVKTYGYHRAGVLAAFVNALTLMGLSVFILWESFLRFRQPEPVHEMTMLVVAASGLVVNVGIMLGLARQRHDLNIRAAFIHMLGDALGSVAIVAGALVIRYTGWQWIDPLLSTLIALLIIWTAWDITKESLNILLEGLPRGMKLDDIMAAMRATAGVLEVHDVHVWSLGSNTHAMSCHVLIDDMPPSESESILNALNALLRERFEIGHSTIQFEHVRCAAGANGCCLPGDTHAAEVHHE
jgi:cobalt-zinc-cadmium efflux system protein